MFNRLRHLFFIIRAYLYACITIQYFYYYRTKKKQSKQKSILFVNTFDEGGGAAKIINSIIDFQKVLRQDQISVIVAHKKNKENNYIELKPTNFKLYNFLNYVEKKNQLQYLFKFNFINVFNQKIYNDSSIIHLHNIHGGYFSPLLLPKISKEKNVVWTLHDMHSFTGHCAHSFSCEKWISGCGGCPDLNIYPKIELDSTKKNLSIKAKCYSKSKLNIVVVSDWLKDKVEKSILSNQNIYRIYNGINTNLYNKHNRNYRNELNLPLDKKIVLFSAELGVNNPFKGGRFINQIIKDNRFKEVFFINIGGGEELELKGNVLTVPYINDIDLMVKYYNSVDVFLYPSLAESFGLVVGEAMACGVCVVAFETGGIPELIDHMKDGYLSKYGSYEELALGLEKILISDDLRELFSKNAINKIQSNFTLEKMNFEYEKLYQSLLDNKF